MVTNVDAQPPPPPVVVLLLGVETNTGPVMIGLCGLGRYPPPTCGLGAPGRGPPPMDGLGPLGRTPPKLAPPRLPELKLLLPLLDEENPRELLELLELNPPPPLEPPPLEPPPLAITQPPINKRFLLSIIFYLKKSCNLILLNHRT